MSNNNSSKMTLVPVMITFFTMGFVDLVGAVSNNMQEDFGLSDSAANFFPSLVFFWFLIFSVPTGMLMNKIGRKKTVLLSIIVTTLAVFLPLFDSFMPTKESQLWLMYISFSLLGIGNAIMQTSLNPLVTIRSRATWPPRSPSVSLSRPSPRLSPRSSRHGACHDHGCRPSA